MTRNTLLPEAVAEREREPWRRIGAWSFHAPVDQGYEGHCVVVEAVRIFDHWHVHVTSGRARKAKGDVLRKRGSMHLGWAGKLILRPGEWDVLRAVLDTDPRVGIYEVEHPTPGQAKRYANGTEPT